MLTIITVCYNSEKTIEKTFETVLNQNFKEMEYLVIDGESKDRTLEIIKKYKIKFKRRGIKFKYITERDRGIYDAMNKGIQLSSGNIIGIINSDDWYEKEAFFKIKNSFDLDPELGVVYGDGIDFYKFRKKNYKILSKQPENLNCLLKGITLHHPSVFVKREVYQKIGGFNLEYKLAADYEFLLRIYKSGIKYRHISDIVAYFLIGGASSNIDLLISEYELIKKRYNLKRTSKIQKKLKKLKKYIPSFICEYLLMIKWKIFDKFLIVKIEEKNENS